MPNWCENHLTINASKELIKEIIFELEGPQDAPYFIPKNQRSFYKPENLDETFHLTSGLMPLSFHKIVPLPPEVLEEANPDFKPSFKVSKFHPPTDYWGTKWPASNVTLVPYDDETIVYMFSTAWSPPMPIIIAIATKFPDAELIFSYAEPGNLFAGRVVYRGGVLREEEYYDEPDHFINFITDHPELGYHPDDFNDDDDN